MKRFLILITGVLFSIAVLAQQNLFKHSLDYYTGKQVKFMLNEANEKYTSYTFIDEPPGVLSSVEFNFPGSLIVKVQVSKYHYLKPFSIEGKWDIKLFLKEKVTKVIILQRN